MTTVTSVHSSTLLRPAILAGLSLLSGVVLATPYDVPSSVSPDLNASYYPVQDKTYSSPYPRYLSVASNPDPEYLKEQSYTLFGASFATIGLMTLLPQETTNWDSESRKLNKLSDKWWNNVTAGPRWDNDDYYLNYVMHPYFGGVYYTAARHAGYNKYDALLYSFTISTFFWEYGVEAVTERPSIQDIIVTPIFGAWAGDAMLYREQQILANDGTVMGSKTLGNISLFFLNPVGHIHHWVTSAWGNTTQLSFRYRPGNYQLAVSLTF